MILETFSQYLKQQYSEDASAEAVLHQWLEQQLNLTTPDNIGKVIQTEIVKVHFDDEVWFVGTSDSGAQLLESLYQYCASYDRWQFSRWLHNVKAADFSSAL